MVLQNKVSVKPFDSICSNGLASHRI